MVSWVAIFQFLVTFGGAYFILAGALSLFIWTLSKLNEMDRK